MQSMRAGFDIYSDEDEPRHENGGKVTGDGELTMVIIIKFLITSSESCIRTLFIRNELSSSQISSLGSAAGAV